MKQKITFQDFKDEISAISKRYHLKDDASFLFWFISAYLTDKENDIKESLTGKEGGKGGDKNIDGIFIDYKAQQCNIIQGKYHITEDKAEKRNDVLQFADIGILPWESKSTIEKFYKDLDPQIISKLKEVINCIKRKKFDLNLYYISTGKCTKTIIDEAKDKLKYVSSQIFIYPIEKILYFYRNYLEGIVPAIPTMRLRISSEGRIQNDGLIRRFDPEKNIESWVLSVNGNDIGSMFEKAGSRLFAKNIRGFLGSTKINESMAYTIKKEPHNFWYYNNGVTIVCDDVKRETKGKNDLLLIDGAQVINGQQTTRILSKDNAKDTNVIVKVIKIPRNWNHDGEYDSLVNTIVRATNWQNFISPSDLVSNDYIQIYLEREFRKKSYQYIRKRMNKTEARREQGQGYFQMKKDELAQAVASTLFDPVVVRKGKEKLFEDPYYKSIFSSHDIAFYLSRYWMMRKVQYAAKGYPRRAYAKWVVLNFVWKDFGNKIDSGTIERKFRYICECRISNILDTLNVTISSVYRAALKFYNLNKGEGEEARDESTFFQLSKLHDRFNDYWYSKKNKYRKIYGMNKNKFLNKLIDVDIYD